MTAATIWEAAGKRGDMSPRIKPLFPDARIAAPAYTVKMFPGETFAAVRAVDEAPPGSVIVIDSGAAERGVCWGGTATFAAGRKGLAGVVTNGTIRDLAEVLERKFPIFATGTSLVAGLRGHPGWLNIPISIGEVVVNPGRLRRRRPGWRGGRSGLPTQRGGKAGSGATRPRDRKRTGSCCKVHPCKMS